MEKASEMPVKKKDINYGEILTIVAVLGGIYYGMRKEKGLGGTGLEVRKNGLVAAFTGNMINKYQTENKN